MTSTVESIDLITASILSLATLPFGWAVPTPFEAATLIAAGVLGGNALAQRLGGRTLQRLFGLMLVAVSLSLAAQKLLGGH